MTPTRRYALMTMLATGGCLLVRPAGAEQPAEYTPAYVSLGEFTVNLPVGKDQGPSYAVVDVTLDADPGAASRLRGIVPRLKESVLWELLTLAGKGQLRPGHTDPIVLKNLLLQNLAHLEPGSIRDVFITRLLYG